MRVVTRIRDSGQVLTGQADGALHWGIMAQAVDIRTPGT